MIPESSGFILEVVFDGRNMTSTLHFLAAERFFNTFFRIVIQNQGDSEVGFIMGYLR